MKSVLVTGSAGLIGSEACIFFGERGFKVYGIDNNERAVFFGPRETLGGIMKGLSVHYRIMFCIR